MNLNEILIQASQIFTRAPVTENDRQFLLFYINLAAREFWNHQSLRSSFREATFTVGPNNILALPADIGEVRAIKICCDRALIRSQFARFQTKDWLKEECYQFDLLGVSPIKQVPVDSYYNLLIRLLEPEEQPVNVLIQGSTLTAENTLIETQFEPLEVEKEIFTQLSRISAIRKSRITKGDLSIVQGDIEMSNIPNTALEARFLLLRIGPQFKGGAASCGCCSTDTCCTPFTGQCFDILYKLPFRPLVHDTDEFLIDGFENQFFFKLMEIKKLAALDDSSESIGLIMQKEVNLRLQTNSNQNDGVTQKIDFGENAFRRLAYGTCYPYLYCDTK